MPDSGLIQLAARPEELVELDPEELAGLLMEHLNGLPAAELENLHHENFIPALTLRFFANHALRREASRALAEAWNFCQNAGFIALDPEKQHGWAFVTRRGKEIRSQIDFRALQKSALLRPDHLHPAITARARAPFLRGNFEEAVFATFKEVEIAVRETGGFEPTDLGVDLMRRAFDPNGGPLADPSLPAAEREAMAHIFAGAIGLLKNPSSHRHIAFENPVEASELIGFASYLMRVVDSRRPPT